MPEAALQAETTHYDIIIVGSGAGGGTLAYALAHTGKKILILERGPVLPVEPQNWDAKAVFIDQRYRTKEQWLDKKDKPFTPNTNYWEGGNTTFYGAALMRMKVRDFEAVEHADGLSPAWPLSYSDYEPWYTKAEKLWLVHGERHIDPNDLPSDPPYPYPPISDDPGVVKLKKHFEGLGWHPSPLPLGINRDEAHPQSSKCIRCTTCGGFPCLLKAKSDARTIVLDPIRDLPNVTILTGHLVQHFETSGDGKTVTSVVTKGADGLLSSFKGDIFALAAGAANSAAVLLRSVSHHHPNGLANGSGLVGRNYMFHTTSAVISILAEKFDSTFPKTFAVNDFYFGEPDGSYPYPMGQIQLLEYMNGPTLEGQIADMIPPALVPDFLADDLARHMVAFLTMSEDLPKLENRITLTEDGQIKLSYTANNLESHLRLTKRLEAGLKGFSLRQHTIFEPHFQIDSLLPLYGTAHQCGTIRFGRDPSTSVLDVNCKAHELDNLYVTDTSFFVSASAVNPTLTTVANALRVGEHLIERMG
ncbi:GMC family oxidoreductase [Asticcacaulis sp. EMRT-3]|uniref:GMC family oxidoreductase n=1 Tax=Asticcacaulis sp. EMRT-3 TaxID=3040349 RepID=UPI0024AF0071|nr:GMC family oxidoreductase [Asticcacaulis sp. EMRT-3]MDI7773849.1 GMC family oxidoreductase [Asticcacaulis sp. EMRT-3]